MKIVHKILSGEKPHKCFLCSRWVFSSKPILHYPLRKCHWDNYTAAQSVRNRLVHSFCCRNTHRVMLGSMLIAVAYAWNLFRKTVFFVTQIFGGSWLREPALLWSVFRIFFKTVLPAAAFDPFTVRESKNQTCSDFFFRRCIQDPEILQFIWNSRDQLMISILYVFCYLCQFLRLFCFHRPCSSLCIKWLLMEKLFCYCHYAFCALSLRLKWICQIYSSLTNEFSCSDCCNI